MTDNPSKFTHEVMKQTIVEIGMELEIDWLKAEIERLREALRECLPIMRRAHDRIHCLPRTSDTELAGEIDITLGIVRAALEEKE